MQRNKSYANEPTVGINFFENIPPVGLENYPSIGKNSTDVKHVSNSTEDKQTTNGHTDLNETQDKAVVKGFGGTALFTFGLLMTSKRIRLDDDGTTKNGTLSNAEDICKRNPTIVKKYCNEEIAEEGDSSSKTIKDEDVCISTDFPDEIFASDCILEKIRSKSNRCENWLVLKRASSEEGLL
jgi:hypothetical protein